MFKQHLEMIGSYEPISKKARFFNTYLKSLKGSQDIVAKEKQRLYTTSFEGSSIFNESKHAAERINSPGYHYNPVSKDTYGVTPRKIERREFVPRR